MAVDSTLALDADNKSTYIDRLSWHAMPIQNERVISIFFPRFTNFTVSFDPDINRVLSKEAAPDLLITEVVPKDRGPGRAKMLFWYGKR